MPYAANLEKLALPSTQDVVDAAKSPSSMCDGKKHMPTQILMPALSPTMEEGTLAKWHVKEGDTRFVRRHHRGDRDRQGDHGSGIDRRGGTVAKILVCGRHRER